MAFCSHCESLRLQDPAILSVSCCKECSQERQRILASCETLMDWILSLKEVEEDERDEDGISVLEAMELAEEFRAWEAGELDDDGEEVV